MEFRVIWEIDINAEGPKEAVWEARAIQLTPGMSATIFDVWAHVAGKMHRIDLIEEHDRLNHDELLLSGLVYGCSSAIRAHRQESRTWPLCCSPP
jgi:hypothetical protein